MRCPLAIVDGAEATRLPRVAAERASCKAVVVGVIKRKVQSVRGKDGIRVLVLQHVTPTIANIGQFQLAVAIQLFLEGEIPLPSVGHHVTRLNSPARSSGRGKLRGIDRTAELTSSASIHRERRVRGQKQVIGQALTLIELANSTTKYHLAVAFGIPGNAKSGRNHMVVLRLQGAIHSSHSAFESCPKRGAGVLPRHKQQPVAGGRTEGWVEEVGLPTGDQVFVAVRITQEGPAPPVFQRDVATNLPGISEVGFVIAPPGKSVWIGRVFAKSPRDLVVKGVEEAISAGPIAIQTATRTPVVGRLA